MSGAIIKQNHSVDIVKGGVLSQLCLVTFSLVRPKKVFHDT